MVSVCFCKTSLLCFKIQNYAQILLALSMALVRTLILHIYVSKQNKNYTTIRKHSKDKMKSWNFVQEMCEFGLMTTNCSLPSMSKFSRKLHRPAATHQQMVAACLSLVKEL